MYDSALIAKRHVRASEDVVGDRLAEDFDPENICYSARVAQVSEYSLALLCQKRTSLLSRVQYPGAPAQHGRCNI